jgi:hypothetical protein
MERWLGGYLAHLGGVHWRSYPMGTAGNSWHVVASEAVCTMERLSAYLFHGNEAHLPKRFWHWLGLTDSLEKCGWPGIDRQKIDFARLPAKRAPLPDLWPLEMDGELLFTQLAAVRFHFGPGVAARRVQELKRLARSSVSSGGVAHNFLKEIVTCYMIPELRDFCLEGFKQKHATLTAQGSNSRLYAGQAITIPSTRNKRDKAARKKTELMASDIQNQLSRSVLWRTFGAYQSAEGWSDSPIEILEQDGSRVSKVEPDEMVAAMQRHVTRN